MQLEKVLQLNLQYLVYFVTNETDIQLKGQERKLVLLQRKLNYKAVYPFPLLLFQRQVRRQISKHRRS